MNSTQTSSPLLEHTTEIRLSQMAIAHLSLGQKTRKKLGKFSSCNQNKKSDGSTKTKKKWKELAFAWMETLSPRERESNLKKNWRRNRRRTRTRGKGGFLYLICVFSSRLFMSPPSHELPEKKGGVPAKFGCIYQHCAITKISFQFTEG